MMYIKKELYKEIVTSLPIVCVDILIKVRETEKYLLVRRNEEPMKGVFWPIGGRKYLGESFLEAAKRLCAREISASDESIIFSESPVGVYHDVFCCSSHGEHKYETLSVLMEGVTGIGEVEKFLVDKTSSVLCEVSELPSRMAKNTMFFGQNIESKSNGQ